MTYTRIIIEKNADLLVKVIIIEATIPILSYRGESGLNQTFLYNKTMLLRSRYQ
jgi:hypothetical protein